MFPTNRFVIIKHNTSMIGLVVMRGKNGEPIGIIKAA